MVIGMDVFFNWGILLFRVNVLYCIKERKCYFYYINSFFVRCLYLIKFRVK